VNSKAKSMLIIFFDVKGIVHKEFVLAGKIVNSAHYCDILRRLRKNVIRLLPELWRQENWLLHHDNAPSHGSSFTREYFIKSKMTVFPHPLYLSLFLRLKIKLKVRHFDTTEVVEEESQAVLNTLTEHDLQDAFKKMVEALEQCVLADGNCFDGDGGL
jgi:hypothetical protein